MLHAGSTPRPNGRGSPPSPVTRRTRVRREPLLRGLPHRTAKPMPHDASCLNGGRLRTALAPQCPITHYQLPITHY
ncbi:MAG: hypothetical protein KME31_01780 [Tolypothrix carrinoi HA7290-LM1]|nr:hypothetical protein [Tolypothrix carrinoi HA7290-LM1]